MAAGRFPLLSDEHVSGPLLQGLARRGWDVQRGIDVFGQRADDEALFAHAATFRYPVVHLKPKP